MMPYVNVKTPIISGYSTRKLVLIAISFIKAEYASIMTAVGVDMIDILSVKFLQF